MQSTLLSFALFRLGTFLRLMALPLLAFSLFALLLSALFRCGTLLLGAFLLGPLLTFLLGALLLLALLLLTFLLGALLLLTFLLGALLLGAFLLLTFLLGPLLLSALLLFTLFGFFGIGGAVRARRTTEYLVHSPLERLAAFDLRSRFKFSAIDFIYTGLKNICDMGAINTRTWSSNTIDSLFHSWCVFGDTIQSFVNFRMLFQPCRPNLCTNIFDTLDNASELFAHGGRFRFSRDQETIKACFIILCESLIVITAIKIS